MSLYSVAGHFESKEPDVRRTYEALLSVAKRFGDVGEEPKKTSIHLVARTAFAGVATRRTKLVLTIKSPVEVRNQRVVKSEKLSANRWHFEVHLATPADVDGDVEAWLRSAYQIST